MRAGITAGYGMGAHSTFYRAGEEGSGWEVGSQEAVGGKCDFNGACVMVPKRNREEGKQGAGEGVERRRRLSGVRSRAEEVVGGARHGGAGQRRRRLGRDRGRRKAPGGPAWAGLRRASRAAVGPVQEFPKKRSWAAMVSWAENQKGCRKNPFQFFKQRFDLKSQ
jgi:hypothetical protein